MILRGGKPKYSERKKPVPQPLCPPHTPHGFTENISGSLPEDCTKIVSGVRELIKTVILFVLMHCLHQVYKQDV